MPSDTPPKKNKNKSLIKQYSNKINKYDYYTNSENDRKFRVQKFRPLIRSSIKKKNNQSDVYNLLKKEEIMNM